MTQSLEARARAVTTLDVFLAAYADQPDANLVNRARDDDLLTWGDLRTILAAITNSSGEAMREARVADIAAQDMREVIP